jgi:hypothetical protein
LLVRCLLIVAYPGNIKKVTKDWVDEDREGGGRQRSLERVGREKMRVSRKGEEGEDEDRVGRGKMRVTRKGLGSRVMKIG